MRTGACTVQQALTAEAASVLKHSLSLARRRGHAQVTPLHVAATLLSSSTSSSNLLRRACLKSQPHHPATHPLQCRALELCFNVALNRLPTTPPPSSGSLIHPHPSLSNALIATLKRAQAHQRRGCIEQQQQQLQQQQQQPLLALKVELEQLIISILDDPSVSRVMREAGFSSTCIKNNIEEDNSSISPPSSSFFFDSHREIFNQGSFWQTHLLKPPSEPNSLAYSSQKEDLKVVLEVMLRKQGKRTNTVLVGDSPSSTERIVAELKGMVERGEVPDELKSSHFINLQLSYVHLRLMSRGDVDMKVSDLRTKIFSLSSDRGGGGVIIIHAGDLRWAVDEEAKNGGASGGGGYGFRPVDHMVAELGRLLSELRSWNGNGGGTVGRRVWLLATASYQTYTRCQMRQPSLETQWALQAVVVPSGGLALSLQAPSGLDSRAIKLSQYPFQMLEPKAFSHREDEDKLNCCVECTSNYEKEVSVLKSDPKDSNHGSSHLPSWLQPHKSDSHHKETLLELRRKWNRLCQSLHHARRDQIHLHSPLFNQSLISKSHLHASSHPWWSSSLPYNQNKIFTAARSISFCDSPPKPNVESLISTAQFNNRSGSSTEKEVPMKWLSEVSLQSLKRSPNCEVRTTLALGSHLFSESATSKDQHEGFFSSLRELSHQLQENIPWQSETIPLIIEALHDCRPSKKGTWVLIQGTDRVGKRRLARLTAESLCGSVDRLVHINVSKSTGKTSSLIETIAETLRKDSKWVVFIEDIDRSHSDFTRTLTEGLKNGFFEDQSGKQLNLAHGFFILTTSIPTMLADTDEKPDTVLKMRWCREEISPEISGKRKPECDSPRRESKKPRVRENELDLNICAEEEDHGYGEVEDAIPSDLTQETDGGGDLHLPHGLLDSITTRFTLDAGPDRSRLMSDRFSSKLHGAFEEARGGGDLWVDPAAVEELVAASGSFIESLFEKWLREVFQTSLPTVTKGGKVRLCVEGKEGNVVETGFMGSVLPNRIHVD